MEFVSDDHRLAHHISAIVGKILKHHEADGLADLVLHDLCHDDCFDLKKAIYLVDNPDFDHLLGVAGFHCNECKLHKQDLWENPYSFISDMKDAQFHNHVKTILQGSLKRKDIDLGSTNDVKDLAKILGINSPDFLHWDLKHGNHGLLIFEAPGRSNNEVGVSDKFDKSSNWRKNLFSNIIPLLGFCGI